MFTKTVPLLSFAVVVAITAGSASAQPAFKRCPAPSSVDGVVAMLNMDVTLGLARVSEEWRKQLRSAAAADSAACFSVENSMYDFVEEATRLRGEVNRVREEADRLRNENDLLKLRLKKSK